MFLCVCCVGKRQSWVSVKTNTYGDVTIDLFRNILTGAFAYVVSRICVIIYDMLYFQCNNSYRKMFPSSSLLYYDMLLPSV